jgi:hypothetical protein
MGADLVRWLSQTSLDGRQIKQAVVFATREIAQSVPCDIDDHREIPLLTIESQDDSSKGNVLFGCIARDDFESVEQIPTIVSIAWACVRAEPLVCMCKQKRGPSPNDLTSLASHVSRSTDGV